MLTRPGQCRPEPGVTYSELDYQMSYSYSIEDISLYKHKSVTDIKIGSIKKCPIIIYIGGFHPVIRVPHGERERSPEGTRCENEKAIVNVVAQDFISEGVLTKIRFLEGGTQRRKVENH